MDTDELIRRAERELAEGNRAARKTVERVRRELLKQRDAEGLESLLVLAGRLDDGGDITYAITQNLRWVSRQPQGQPPPTIKPSRLEQAAGVTLFLVVTACWTLWWALSLASGDASSGLASPADTGGMIAAVPSAMSVVVTGYLLGRRDAATLLLGWIPGALMMAIGFLFAGEVPDDLGWIVFIGGLLLMVGWPVYFFPLIAIGAYLRGRRVNQAAPAPPAESIQPQLSD